MEMTVVVETLLSSWKVLLLALAPLHLSEEHTGLVTGHCILPTEIRPTYLVRLSACAVSQLQLCVRMCDMAKSTILFTTGVNPAVLTFSFALLCLPCDYV